MQKVIFVFFIVFLSCVCSDSLPSEKILSMVMLGDSRVALGDFSELQNNLGINIENKAVGGSTMTHWGGERFLPFYKMLQYNYVFLAAGGNDLAGGVPKTRIIAKLNNVVSALKFTNTRLIIHCVLPLRLRYNEATNKDVIELNHMLKNYCAVNNIFYIDCYADFLDNAGFLRADYVADADTNQVAFYFGVHFSAKGYQEWNRILTQELKKIL